MLDTKRKYKCKVCGKIARHLHLEEHYCTKHFILEIYKCDNVRKYLELNNIKYMNSAIDNHIIINNRIKDVINLCELTRTKYWFGVGEVNSMDMSNCMHIDIKAVEE